MKRHIPNLLTSLNLFSGCIACVMAFEAAYFWVVFFVILGAIFDFFDGFSARLLKAYSPIGKELDSLADMVTFGVAPSLMVFRYLSDHVTDLTPISVINPYIPYFAFLLAVFSALRLANFNVDERQTTSFIGLNTPSNALFWISFVYGINNSWLLESVKSSPILIYVILVLILIFSFLMIAEIPMFSLKIKGIQLKGNELRYLLIVFMITAVILVGILGIAAGILFYIGLSVLSSLKKENA